MADYLVLCTGGSDTQVRAIVENISEGMRKLGDKPMGVEGVEDGRWALMDFVDVVAHVFYRPVREHYDIEGLWADAPRLSLDGGGGEKGEEGA